MDNEINEALIGADELALRVNYAMSLGGRSLKSQTYQTKYRVKSRDSLKQKIQEKRLEKDENYSAHHVTDIIGIRLIVLFQQDLITLVERFVDFIRDFQNNPVDIFNGTSQIECVTEAIVYQSKDNQEVYDAIYKFLSGHFVKNGFDKQFVKIEKKDTKYSSVHFIILGQIHIGGEVKIIPIEFQLRTVFEDAWGEIQHYLVYKNDRINGDPQKKMFGEKMLESLKGFLDNCSDTASNAYVVLRSAKEISAITFSSASINSNIASVLKGMEKILPASAEASIQELRNTILNNYDILKSEDMQKSPNKIRENFENLIKKLEEFETRWAADVDEIENSNTEFKYAIDMEKASANYWIGQSLLDFDSKPIADTSDVGENVSQAMNFFEKSRIFYFDLTSHGELSDDPVLNYRIAQIYRKLSQRDIALLYQRAAFDKMQAPGWRDKGSIFEVLIPRQLAYMIWSETDDLVQKHLGLEAMWSMSDNERKMNPVIQKYLISLNEAFLVSAFVATREVSGAGLDTASVEMEKHFTLNNGLFYAIEFIGLGGDANKLRSKDGSMSFDQDYYLKFHELNKSRDVTELEIAWLDTLLRASVHFSDKENGLIWLKEAKRRMASEEWSMTDKVTKTRIGIAIRMAQEKFNI